MKFNFSIYLHEGDKINFLSPLLQDMDKFTFSLKFICFSYGKFEIMILIFNFSGNMKPFISVVFIIRSVIIYTHHLCNNFYCFYGQLVLKYSKYSSGKESACQCRRHRRFRFNLWVGKISWRRKWQPAPVFLLGKSHWTEESVGQQSIGLQRVPELL